MTTFRECLLTTGYHPITNKHTISEFLETEENLPSVLYVKFKQETKLDENGKNIPVTITTAKMLKWTFAGQKYQSVVKDEEPQLYPSSMIWGMVNCSMQEAQQHVIDKLVFIKGEPFHWEQLISTFQPANPRNEQLAQMLLKITQFTNGIATTKTDISPTHNLQPTQYKQWLLSQQLNGKLLTMPEWIWLYKTQLPIPKTATKERPPETCPNCESTEILHNPEIDHTRICTNCGTIKQWGKWIKQCLNCKLACTQLYPFPDTIPILCKQCHDEHIKEWETTQ